MPPKKLNKYSVVSIQLKEPTETKLVVVPFNWAKDNSVTYPDFPLTQDDTEMIDSFLKLANKLTTDPPISWPKYDCTVLESFATVTGALNRVKKLQEDPKALQAVKNKASLPVDDIPSKKSKLEESIMESIENSIENLAPPPPIPMIPGSLPTSQAETLQLTPALPNGTGSFAPPPPIPMIPGSLHTSEAETLQLTPALPNGTGSFVVVPTETVSFQPAIIYPQGSSLEMSVDIVNENIMQEDKSEQSALCNLNLNSYTKNTACHEEISQVQQYLLANTSEIQGVLRQISIMSGQMVLLCSKNEELTKAVDVLSEKVTLLSGEVKELNSKSKKEKIAAVDVSVKLQELHTAVVDRRALKEKENVVTFNKLESKHELTLPFLTLEDFQSFDLKLEDNSLAEDLKLHFLSTISEDGNLLKNSMILTMRAFFSKDILVNITTQIKKPGKLVLNKTRFYRIWKNAVHNLFSSNFDEKLFKTRIGHIIKNSGDWDGREGREKQNLTD